MQTFQARPTLNCRSGSVRGFDSHRKAIHLWQPRNVRRSLVPIPITTRLSKMRRRMINTKRIPTSKLESSNKKSIVGRLMACPNLCPFSCPLPGPSGRWIVGDQVEHDECSLAGQQRAQSMRRFCRRVHTLDQDVLHHDLRTVQSTAGILLGLSDYLAASSYREIASKLDRKGFGPKRSFAVAGGSSEQLILERHFAASQSSEQQRTLLPVKAPYSSTSRQK